MPAADPAPQDEPARDAEEPARDGKRRSRAARWRLHLLAPAALTLFLSFRAGGFFAGVTGLTAAGLAVALAVYLTSAPRPFAGVSAPLMASAAGLTGFAVWILLSVGWSHSPGRAIIEFDRALLYLLVLVLFGLVARRPGDLGRLLQWLALAIAAVALAALLTRLLPEQLPTGGGVSIERLQFPLTYWNALGLICVVGLVLNLRLSAGLREPVWARLLGAAAIPVLAVTLYFTFSRGAILAAFIGVGLLVLLGPTRGLVSAAIAALPTTAFALVEAYGADRLATVGFSTAAARPEAHRLLAVMAGAVVAAVVLRVLCLLVDRRLGALRMPSVRAPVVIGAAVVLIAGFAAAVASSGIKDRSSTDIVRGSARNDLRNRLTHFGDPNRLAHWRIEREEFSREPWQGSGAGTFRIVWERERPFPFRVNDGHSLYLETMSEMGIPGLALLLLALLPPLVVAATRLGSRNRHAYAAYLAASVALLAHAGIDWDWENPALFAWFFASSGVVLAAPADRGGTAGGAAPLVRLLAGLACLGLAVTPTLMAVNQGYLDRASNAFDRGDCRTAIDAALDSAGAFNVRADPFEILGYCDTRARNFPLAVRAFEAARHRDPGNWQYSYGLAVAQALAGTDPRPAAAEARRENPLEILARTLDDRLRAAGSSRRRWFRVAARAGIPRQ
jgi:O-antigen ligase